MEPTARIGGIGQTGGTLNPPKKWDELTSDEKIEILRGEVMMTRYLTRRIGELESEVARFKAHEHGVRGDVVIPIVMANNGGANLASRSYDPLN